MTVALWLLALHGVLGAFDNFYDHEWRARLPARGRAVAAELKLHCARKALYAVIFGTLPWLEWRGVWTAVLVAVLLAEIVITLADFVAESVVRKPFGDVYAGERVTHAVIGIIYGAMLANMLPVLSAWWALPSGLVAAPAPIPPWLRYELSVMAAGVALFSIRDIWSALELPYHAWPWPIPADASPAEAAKYATSRN